MKASRFTSRFKRTAEVRPQAAGSAPVETGQTVSESAALPAAESVTAETAAAAETPSAEQPAPATRLKASRLVESVRPTRHGIDMTALGARLQAARPALVPAAAAAAIVLSLGVGYGLGSSTAGPGASTLAQLETTVADLRHTNQELARLAAETKSLRGSVEGFKGERDKTRAEILSRQAQLADKLERANQDQAARIGRMADTVERLEKAQRDPARLQAMTERLDRIEKSLAIGQVAAAPTPPPKPAGREGVDVAQTGSIGEVAPPKAEIDPRKTKVEGYFVRDFDSGFALIETRAGRYLDVAVGYTVPGIGRVESIERRGRQWVVVTPKGYIAER